MSEFRFAEDALAAAERRLDDDMARLRQATIRASQITFEPVDLTQSDKQSGGETRDREFQNRLSDLMNEWHEDNGWAAVMPDEVRTEFVERVRASITEDIAKGRLQ
ncbi:hypothetical protein ASG12_14530 [Williamsia sp. Leaf354]|jgi:hypothetical protein|uniref:hypothetical protein n=1 Tax=Williamsia sp. Leaf354 TaxID=1736349 RepID=UPI0006FC040E|nr:hypothetical protein [Williamsia sp. Leaf354]KQR98157.1 hypothetical protein ASG12_14530 [Williamsia sp. Leaf354]